MKKTIKIIDLLNKIANGEEVPKKIKYKDYEYWYLDDLKDYKNAQVTFRDYLIADRYHSANWLNDEVEIIEEDKKIEKIKSLNNVGNCQNLVEFGDKQQLNNHILKDKINEIIDAINELKKGE